MAKRKGGQGRVILRPFACEEPGCGRCFTRYDHLQRHALVHDDDAVKLSCPQCGKTFLRNDMLVRHQRSVHDSNKMRKTNDERASVPAKKTKATGGSVKSVAPVGIPAANTSASMSASYTYGLATDSSQLTSSLSASTSASSQLSGFGSGAATTTTSLQDPTSASSVTWSGSGAHTPEQQMLHLQRGRRSGEVSPTSEKSWTANALPPHCSGSTAVATPATMGPPAPFFWPSYTRGGSFTLPTPLLPASMASAFNDRYPQDRHGRQVDGQSQAIPLPLRQPDGSHPPEHLGSSMFPSNTLNSFGLGAIPRFGHHNLGTDTSSGSAYTFPNTILGLDARNENSDTEAGIDFSSSLALTGARLHSDSVSSASSTYSFPAYQLDASFPSLLGETGCAMDTTTTSDTTAPLSVEATGPTSAPMGRDTTHVLLMGATPTVPSQLTQQALIGLGPAAGAVGDGRVGAVWSAAESAVMNDSAMNGAIEVGLAPLATSSLNTSSWASSRCNEETPAVNRDRAGGVVATDNGHTHMWSISNHGAHGIESYAALSEEQAWFAAQATRVQCHHPQLIIDETVYARLLAFLHRVPNLATSPVFTPLHISVYLARFFEGWNAVVVPMLHEPTFDAAATSEVLLAACIIMGSHFVPTFANTAQQLGQRLAEPLWANAVGLDIFAPRRINLELLQALVLLDAYGTLFGTRQLHELADCFHPLIVTMARRNAIFDSGVPPSTSASSNAGHAEGNDKVVEPTPSCNDTESDGDRQRVAWRGWLNTEEKIRVAHGLLLLDVVHATLFGHQRAVLHVPDDLALPAPEQIWKAASPAQWAAGAADESGATNGSSLEQAATTGNDTASARKDTRHRLRDALDDFLGAGEGEEAGASAQAFGVQGGFSWLAGLVGLLGLTLESERPSRIEADKPNAGQDQRVVGAEGLENWRRYKDSTVASASASSSPGAIFASDLGLAGQLSQHADMIVLQTACGVNPVLGRYVGEAELVRCRKVVHEWAGTERARMGVLIALRGLQSVLGVTRTGDAADEEGPATDGRFIGTWVSYLCAVALFSFARAHDAEAGEQYKEVGPAPDDDGTVEVLFEQAHEWTTSTMEVATIRRRLGGLLELVEAQLAASRWELGLEAAATLRRLRLST